MLRTTAVVAVLSVVAILSPSLVGAAAAAPNAPLAFFTATPNPGKTGGTFHFDASLSAPGANASRIVSYAWRWNATGAFEPGNATESHRFDDAGVIVVTLRITDDRNASADASQTILVAGAKPEPYFVVSVLSLAGSDASVELNATFSRASAGAHTVVKYEWKFGDATNESFFVGNVTERHVYHGPGTFTATLRITDDAGRTDTATSPVVVGSTFYGRLLRVWHDRDSFILGAKITVELAVISIFVGFFVAIPLALMRVSRFWILKAPATVYVEVIRGTPLLVQILISWLVLPQLGLKLDIFWAGAVALIANTAAYQSEVIRAGIQSIPSGQLEAALSLGMTYTQAMRLVVLPQAFRLVIPPLGNEFIILLKDTSLVSVIGVVELTRIGSIFSARTFLVLETWLAVAFVYFVMTYALSFTLKRLERRVKIPGLGVEMAAH
ncbi:MAG: ABC transporter permease subunit [Thermoplasmatota archaeon]